MYFFENNCSNTNFNKKILTNSYYNKLYNYVYLKHYITKSLEEFIKKTKKGHGTEWGTKHNRHKINLYFKYNIKTSEKIKYLKQYELRHNSMS